MYTKEFPIINGVRQGAVISSLFFCYHMDSLFDILAKSGSGCHIDTYYAGCFGYADDLLLICPSRKGLQDMLDLAEIYVSKHNISFSTNPDLAKSKTKAIIFTRKKLKFVPTELRLNGNALPWVEQASYLGNIIENTANGLAKDTLCKRARYIERNMELTQEFPIAHPEVKCKINRVYNSSFPGSVLYNLASDQVGQLTSSWSVSVRKMWELPMQTHRYLIEPLSGDHAHSMLIVRFVKFLQSMLKSGKRAVHYMLRKVVQNTSSTTGNNVSYIQDLIGQNCDILDVNTNWLKKKLTFHPMEDSDQWRVILIKEITNINYGVIDLHAEDSSDAFLSNKQLKEIVEFACCT